MKTYEKPRLMALSLNGNDRLCGDCAGKTTIYNSQDLILILGDMYGDLDGRLTRDEYIDGNLFVSAGDNCTQLVSLEYEQYCKFNATDDGLKPIAWS